MQKLKKSLFVFLIVFFFLPLAALEMPDLSAQWGVSFPARRDVRNPSPAEDFIVAADFTNLHLDSGIKYQCNQLDLTNRIFYMPHVLDCIQAGGGFTWHFYRYIDVFTENDLTLTGRFRWIAGPVFSFENSLGLLFKFASIDAIKEYKPVIFNLSYQHELLCNWHLNTTDLWFALNLQDYFDYPLAISPFFKFGVNYATKQNTVLGADLTLKFIDMFFSAVYLNEAVMRFTVKVVI